MLDYPSPCETCTKERCGNIKCEKWVARYIIRQRQINAKAVQLAGEQKASNLKHWGLMHPDEYRRYLTTHPCQSCFVENICDTPCPWYLRWYNERMVYARKKVGL